MENTSVKSKNTLSYVLIGIIAVLLLVIGVGAFIAYRIYENNAYATLRLNNPDGTVTVIKAVKGTEIDLAKPECDEDHVFISWVRDDGTEQQADSIKLMEDTEYYSKCAVTLNTRDHIAYLSQIEGCMMPNADMTRSDAVIMIYTLLAEKPRAIASFLDVSTSDSCYRAAGALKSIGVISGDRLHGDDVITKGELLSLLENFYPEAEGEYKFKDLRPGDEHYSAFCVAAENGWIKYGQDVSSDSMHLMSRRDTVILMNDVLHRDCCYGVPDSMVGGCLDTQLGGRDYAEFIEAAVTHEHGDGKWLSSEPLAKLDEGFRIVNRRMMYVDKNGRPSRGVTVDGYSFDNSGIYTSGNTDLDALLFEALDVSINDDMSHEEMLRAVYDYMVHSYTYLRKPRSHYRGEKGWSVADAYEIMSTGRGNCYNYAAALCELCKAIGYPAEEFSGYVGLNLAPHGWVEIEIDGVRYVFDCELEMAALRNSGRIMDMYKMTYARAYTFVYSR